MQNLFAKTAGVVVAVALFVGVAVPATSALTASEITALLVAAGVDANTAASLAAALGGSTGTTSSSSYTFTRDLTIGATGADVVALQDFLVSKGYLTIPAGVSKGYFGSLTQSALAKFQAANGITPAAGYFGPATRAKVASMMAPVVVPPTTGGSTGSVSGLSGGDGDFKSFDVLGNPDNENVEEGETIEVLGFEFEADDSDLLVERVTVLVEADTVSGSTTKPWKVLEEVSVVVDGDEVASVDVSDEDAWDEESDDVYSLDIDDVDYKVEEGDEVKMYVAVTATDDLDEDEIDQDWTIELAEDGVRALNAEGISIYEDSAEVNTFTLTEVDPGSLDLSFDEDETGNDDDDVDIDDNDETEGVVLYTFTAEAEDGDVELDEITVTLATSTGTGSDLEDIISELVLEVDGDEFSESVEGTSTATVVFDDLESSVSEDDEITIVVKATIEGADDIADFSEGDGLKVTGVTVDYTDSEDDDQTADELDGTAGGVMTLRENGMMVELVSTDQDETFTADEAGEGDIGSYVIKFEISAGDEDIYVGGVDYSFSNATSTGDDAEASFSGPSSKLQDSGNYKVSQGSSVQFSLTVELEVASTTSNTAQKLILEGIDWNLDDSTTTYESYDSNLDDYETEDLFLRGL